MLKKIDNRIFELRKIQQEILRLLEEEKSENGSEQQRIVQEPPVKSRKMLEAKSLKELRVAAIMDEFTLGCFSPECQLTELTPQGWRQEMEMARPELLFVDADCN